MRSSAALLSLAVVAAAAKPEAPSFQGWKRLQPGVEYGVFIDYAKQPYPGDPHLHVVRIDPTIAALKAATASSRDGRARTAQAWCGEAKLAAAINMGMYRTDHLTNVGYARLPEAVNNPKWNDYRSALAFGPKDGTQPKTLWLDLDSAGAQGKLAGYGSAIQNLRLIRAPGKGVWGKQDKRWSEAAVASDKQGRILFIFSRYPYSMKELNDKLLSLPLGITAAMHVEGGPEASLSIHAGGVDLDLNGSYETGFVENDEESRQWPIPNVLGVAAAP